MKKALLIVSSIVLLPIVYFFIGHVSDEDCDSAMRAVIAKLEEENRSVIQVEGEVGRCDGLCVNWTVAGCYIQDDEQTWFVAPWGSVWQTE